MKYKSKTVLGITATLLFGLIGISINYTNETEIESTPESVRYGWAPEHVEELQEWASLQGPFVITDPVTGEPVTQANENVNVGAWRFADSPGQYPDLAAQQTGDCTSWGCAHALWAIILSQIHDGAAQELKRPFPPFQYGTSRVDILRGRIRGAGSTGSATAKSAQEFGILPADTPGLPAYSGALADQWGRSGVPQQWKDIAAKYKVQSVALVRQVGEVRDAICNGYGVTIASDFGTKTIRPRDGHMVATWDAKWPHQMCVDGYDGSTGNRYYHIQNSWGPKAHPAPVDDSPPGGFWVTEADMARIVGQGDSWVYSKFDGFPATDLDLRIFGAKEEQKQVKRQQEEILQQVELLDAPPVKNKTKEQTRRKEHRRDAAAEYQVAL